MAIGGSLGGWIDGMFDGQGVFLAGAMLAAVWLAVASTMKEPPYVSSLRIEIPDNVMADEKLEKKSTDNAWCQRCTAGEVRA